jgi:uncharacterized damage-inducible protein DinB
MFAAPEEDPRSQELMHGERDTVLSYLLSYRQTLEMKCAGLDAAAMAQRSVPPSDMSLLGLVRHMADVERHWFREVMARDADVRPIFRTVDDRDAAFTDAAGDPALVEEAWSAWKAEVAFAEEFVDQANDLGMSVPLDTGQGQGQLELREVLVHMVEEYARHCGHADFLRERIDGRVGQ